ncbi:diaminopimelate epimerase [Acidiferrobacter sp.]|uniref:diaminopimelate epimerase n=1 Tax=Acidiferrobacter sp. TaxID=1872107 RepID=UPI00262407B9|nr:diaminopimelate epimerase [Acidiferrobacter sp.]
MTKNAGGQRFVKMHGLGNDFVVLDAVTGAPDLTPERIRLLADRHFGVGCDQVLVVLPSTEPGVDFGYRIFNADGTEVQQCGNGARCFARYVRDEGLSAKPTLTVRTMGGIITLSLQDDGEVVVNMGLVRWDPGAIPFLAERETRLYTLDVGGRPVEMSVLSLGNPHAVVIVADVERAPVADDGPLIERHARFPQGVNVGFMQIIDRGTIRLRVHERGAGETLACGSGACAAVVAGRERGLLDDDVLVHVRGGRLRVRYDGAGPVWMRGPAQRVYEGWFCEQR